MLATDRFLFISLGRCSTGTVHKWLCEVPDLRIISSVPHESYQLMADKCIAAGIDVPPVWTIIRNPWDRYVDAYLWDQNCVHLHDGTFKDFLRRTRAKEWGFPSLARYWNYLGGNKAAYVARYEDFDNEIVRVVMALIPDLVSEEFIRRKNEEYRTEGDALTPDGKPWRLEPPDSYIDYYDMEAEAWVAEIDAKLIKRFGYTFGGIDAGN